MRWCGREIDAVLVSQGGDFLAQRTLIVGLAAKHRLPTMYPFRDYVELAAVADPAPSWANSPSEWPPTCSKSSTAPRPAISPFSQPAKWEMVINLKTAKALGLEFRRRARPRRRGHRVSAGFAAIAHSRLWHQAASIDVRSHVGN